MLREEEVLMKGGARARSGPPPDPNALRRSRKSDPAWTKIAADCRKDQPVPEWPLVEPSARELELWTAWWSLPVASLWLESHSLDYVAFTVRMFSEAEQRKARTEDRKSLRQMMADLYMNPDSQLRARILILDADGEAATPAGPPPAADGTVTDIRDRLNRGAS